MYEVGITVANVLNCFYYIFLYLIFIYFFTYTEWCINIQQSITYIMCTAQVACMENRKPPAHMSFIILKIYIHKHLSCGTFTFNTVKASLRYFDLVYSFLPQILHTSLSSCELACSRDMVSITKVCANIFKFPLSFVIIQN